MKDSTAHVQAMIDLVEVIRAAIEASSQFGEENAVGSYRNCMSLFVGVAGGPDDGLELVVSVTAVGPEEVG